MMPIKLWISFATKQPGGGGIPCGIVSNMLDCNILVSSLKLHHYVHFQTNILGKDMNTLILLALG